MVWWYLCLVSFVDLTAQLGSAGEYYAEKLSYDLLLCVCVIVRARFYYVFVVYIFSQEEETKSRKDGSGGGGGRWQRNPLAMGGGDSE